MKPKTWNFDENVVIDAARKLGISVTEAEFGTELCQAWADRVLGAKMAFEDGDMELCRELIGEANRYAI